MKIIPLSDYPSARRPFENKSRSSWTHQARAGKIPGALRFTEGGDWFVVLDTHDREVQKRVALAQTVKIEFDNDDIRRLVRELGITEEDIRIGIDVAGT